MTLIFVSFFIVGIYSVGCFRMWQDTFIGQNSGSSNPEVTKRKSQVSNSKSILSTTQKQKL